MSDMLNYVEAPGGSPTLSRAKQFICQVEGAAAFLKAAHSDDHVTIDPPSGRSRREGVVKPRGWYSNVITTATRQLRHIILVFDKHPARGSGAAAELEAFRILSEVTTAGPQLQVLVHRNRTLAVKELTKHLELIWRQFEATAELADTLADDLGANDDSDAKDADKSDFGHMSAALLDRAGGALSLTEAAKLLGVTRQALHKRIATGSTLGMMIGAEIAVPKLQIAERDGRQKILPGIDAVTKLFKRAGAGPWMALQFLVDKDPNLHRPPIDLLRAGDGRSVLQAAGTHLRLDEG